MRGHVGALVGLLGVALLLGAAPCTRASEPPPGVPPGFVPPPSIHQLEWQRRRERPLPEPDGQPPRVPARERAALADVVLNRVVYGFLPYWVAADLSHIRWELLSHVAYFSVSLNADGSVTNLSGSYAWPFGAYPAALRSATQAAGVKVTLTATNFSSSSIATLLGSAANRQNAIDNLVALVDGTGDGVNIDLEGVPLSQKANLVTFMADLAAAVHAAVPGGHVSVCTPAVDWAGAFDYDQLALACDALFIMGYDYHWSSATTAGPCAPLTGGGVWGTYNVTWTIDDYMTWGGSENRSKFLLGVPYYGYEWPTSSTSVPSSTTGTGSSKTYNVARVNAATYGRLWDVASQTPYYVYTSGGARQGWYDDAESLGYKWDLVNSQDLGGTGIWALNYDTADTLLWDQLQAKLACLDAAAPAVTPPSALTLDQTSCCGAAGGAGATSAGSAALASFLAAGSAVDDCAAAPQRLPAQVAAADVTSANCFPPGTTPVTFRFRDATGKTGSAVAGVTVRAFGDLNLDTLVDPSDWVILRDYLNFVVTPGTPPFSAPLGLADVSHEGSVDPGDFVVLRDYLNFVTPCLAP